MDKNQVALVQNTWVQVTPHADAAAALFYQRLFDVNPEYQALFSGDMREQGLKLMQMLGTVVAGLHEVENLIPTVQDLGRRHAGYGVAAIDYDAVGEALLWTLEQELGDAYTSDVAQAWAAAYTTLAAVMTGATEGD